MASLHTSTTGSFFRRVFANPDGGFVLDELPPGEYTVMAIWHIDGRWQTRVGLVTSVHVGPGAIVDIEIDIDARDIRSAR